MTFSYMYIMYFDRAYLPHHAIFPSPFLPIFLFLVRLTSVFMSLSFLRVCTCACAYMYAYVLACLHVCVSSWVSLGLLTEVWVEV